LNAGSLASAAVAGVNAAIASELGTDTSRWGKVGTRMASMLGSYAVGPAGGLIGTVGGVTGMALGDMLDARSMEDIRDAMEDNLGFFGGLQAFSDFVSSMGAAGFDTGGMTGWGGFEDLGIGNPGSYGGDSGIGTGIGTGHSDQSGTSGRYAMGGIVDSLMVPNGEDGLAALQFGEGVVSRRGMAALDDLNSGGDSDVSELLMVLISEAREDRNLSRKVYRVLDRVTGGKNSFQTRAEDA